MIMCLKGTEGPFQFSAHIMRPLTQEENSQKQEFLWSVICSITVKLNLAVEKVLHTIYGWTTY